MLGRDPEFWRAQLHSTHLPVRLFALRTLRQMGSQGARMLLEAKVDLPEWPFVWALQGCATPALLRSGAPHSPQRLALTLQRRTPRSRAKIARQSLSRCIAGLRKADNAHQRLSWMMILLEQHGEAATEDLLGLISTPTPERQQWEQLAALAAWALGQLGRGILFNIQERFRQGAPAVQVWLCQALWHLGPQAQGSESFLATAPGIWASAALYALEGAGTRALIQRREAPLWVDRAALGRLAELIQSKDRDDRHYAARALAGWGPALARVARLLEGLCHDPENALRDLAWRGLEQLGGVTSPQALRAGLHSQDVEVRAAALACFRDNYGNEPVEILRRHLHDSELSLLTVLAIEQTGLQPHQLDSALKLLPRLHGVHLLMMLGALSQSLAPPTEEPVDLGQLIHHRQVDTRQAVARLLMAWKRPARELAPLLDDQDAHIARQVTEHLLENPSPETLRQLLGDGPRLAQRLLQLESQNTLGRLERLGSSRAQLASVLERLRQLAQIGEPEVQRAANRILKAQNLDTLMWSDFDTLEPELQYSLVSLVRESGALPDGLRAGLLEGLYVNPTTLSLALETLPVSSASTLLWSCFIKCPHAQREHFLLPLLQLDQAGWELLLELLAHQDPEVSEDAIQLLLRWLDQRGLDLLADESLLKTPPCPEARGQLAVGLAQRLSLQEEARWFPWLRALARQTAPTAARLALQALSRSHEEPAFLEILAACNHPHEQVRLEALQLLHPQSPEQIWLSTVRLRAYGIDPHPRVQIRRYLWMQEAGDLTTYELDHARELRLASDDPELLQEIDQLSLGQGSLKREGVK
ncbi:MAG: HEAT repeat domain-containing protein [Candidatus Eremiobacteraeota bacterium]|nr:HEAT repeat domain-containing protein [Candidatus Eremiobacteraeota bacterium]MCW5871520.1 HEAT repeat domain-containing protein [Candidatus Eremiobacteraeota bacterium]